MQADDDSTGLCFKPDRPRIDCFDDVYSISCAAAAAVGDPAELPGADVGGVGKVAKLLIPVDTVSFALSFLCKVYTNLL